MEAMSGGVEEGTSLNLTPVRLLTLANLACGDFHVIDNTTVGRNFQLLASTTSIAAASGTDNPGSSPSTSTAIMPHKHTRRDKDLST